MNKFYFLKILLLVILFSSAQSVFAQLKDKFLHGSIVLQSGETVNGFVQDEEIAKMNYIIRFKERETEKKVILYDTSKLKTLTLENGEIYELIHYKGKYMPGAISVIAKLIVKGKASLYQAYYKEDEIYIITTNENSYPLQNDKLEQGSTELTVYDFKILLNNALFEAHIPAYKFENAAFSKKNFISLVTDYNTAMNAENKIIKVKRKPVRYIIAGAGGMVKNSKEKEVYLQAIYRSYFPKISRSASLNLGINYFNYHYQGLNKYGYLKNLNTTLISLPFQLQQNLLNKSIRPYAFIGLNLSYIKSVDDKGITQLDKGLQQNIGIGMLYGGGIEADVYKGVMLKGEYRDENLVHLIMVGIAYNFSK